MLPTSIPRATSRGAPQRGQGSPLRAAAMSRDLAVVEVAAGADVDVVPVGLVGAGHRADDFQHGPVDDDSRPFRPDGPREAWRDRS